MAERPNIHIDKPGHILVLDKSWHQLFKDKKSFRIKQLEKQLNNLLKEQGKVNTEYDAYKKLKKAMMDEIMATMNDDSSDAANKKASNSRHIKEINKKFDRFEKKKIELPTQIEAVNNDLLTESMIICYKRLMDAKTVQETTAKELAQLKEAIKLKAGEKEDIDQDINNLYTFMHDIAGLEAIEQLDAHYFGGKK